jgi:hypothetical protein
LLGIAKNNFYEYLKKNFFFKKKTIGKHAALSNNGLTTSRSNFLFNRFSRILLKDCNASFTPIVATIISIVFIAFLTLYFFVTIIIIKTIKTFQSLQ